jgi:putative hydrolase of the HAD superfamily
VIRAIVFDFGNVVGFFDHYKTLAKLAPYTDWPAKRIYEEIYASDFEDDLESGRITVDAFIDAFIRRIELRCDAAFLKTACADIFTPNPEVCELIPQLRDRFRIVLGSNTNLIHATQFRRQFADVLGHMHGHVLSYEIGVRKPLAGFFEHCAKVAECAPSECVFIDDLPVNIAGAKSIGMHGIVYRPGQELAATLDRMTRPK